MLVRFRELRERNPENHAAKRGLARALALFSRAAAFYYDKPEDALAAALEARSLWSEILATEPAGTPARTDYADSLSAVANACHAMGEIERAVEIGEDAAAYAENALKDDPDNLRLLQTAATIAQNLGTCLSSVSMHRSRDAELNARRLFRRLMEREPANTVWQSSYAQAHQLEAQYLWADGQTEAARAAFRTFESKLESHAPFDHPPIQGAAVRLSLQLALAAARSGDLVDCDEQLRKAQARFESYHATLPADSVQPHQARAVWLHGRCQVARETRDWDELGQLAREFLDEVGQGLVYQPNNGELLLRRAAAQTFLGEALLQNEAPSEAVSILREAAEGFRDAPRALLRFTEPRDVLAADASELLAQALAQLGDVKQARILLESALATRKSYLAKEPGLWRWKLGLARTSAFLAGVLDPSTADNAARRHSLLDRAAELLTSPENSRRLTVADKELIAEVQLLRVMR
jgi:tetratricopeptide (TPR) repeat protein